MPFYETLSVTFKVIRRMADLSINILGKDWSPTHYFYLSLQQKLSENMLRRDVCCLKIIVRDLSLTNVLEQPRRRNGWHRKTILIDCERKVAMST